MSIRTNILASIHTNLISNTVEEHYMLRCLQLAQKGQGSVSPNPMVGAVLVYNNTIIGEGWHQKYGHEHAEVNCIKSVTKENQHLISKSTLYVSLEPCSHFGKTPPCCNLIIESKIRKVVIACKDPFDKVAGKGIAILQQNNIEVVYGVLENVAQILNKRFFAFHRYKRPYVILKWAESNDGFIASEKQNNLMLSNAYSQRMVHRMRSAEDAIMVGYNTALKDNPQLNVRLAPYTHQPTRVVLDFENNLPPHLHLFDNQLKTLVFNFFIDKIEKNTEWIAIHRENKESAILTELYKRNILSLIIEGGTKTLQPFIEKGLWNEAIIIKTNKNIVEGLKAPSLSNAKFDEQYHLDYDEVLQFIYPIKLT